MSNCYTGFRNWANQECPSLKPGETYDKRDKKFSNMTSRDNISVSPASYTSWSQKVHQNVSPGDYRIPDRRGVMVAKDKLATETVTRPFVGTSTYQQTFESPNVAVHPLSLQDYRAGYDAALKQNDGNDLTISDIEAILTASYNGTPPAKREVQVYEKVFESLESQYLSWGVLAAQIPAVNNFLIEECKTVGGKFVKPPWMEKEAQPKVLKGITGNSRHQLDFGKYGEDPSQRPYVRKTGMASTTGDLEKGTSSDTHHIPGYRGFIPIARNNRHAVEQAEGTAPRPLFESIRQTHRDNMSGYTGHKPESCNNYRGAMLNGTDAKTTNGATYTNLNQK